MALPNLPDRLFLVSGATTMTGDAAPERILTSLP